MEALTDTTVEIDLSQSTVRELNAELHAPTSKSYRVSNSRGLHAVAVGLKDEIDVEIDGDVGYYCAGMHQKGNLTIAGMAGPGVAEYIMSSQVPTTGHASHTASA